MSNIGIGYLTVGLIYIILRINLLINLLLL